MSSDSMHLSIRSAGAEDVERLVGLINAAYRSDASRRGWTTEADLLGGQRTADAAMMAELLEGPDSLMLLACQGAELVGCVHLQKEGDRAWLGMLAIRPERQGAGLGKQVMGYAERFARQQWRITTMVMGVITRRPELIVYYQRRGYQRTGERHPFPKSQRFGIPRVPGLEFEVLEKSLEADAL